MNKKSLLIIACFFIIAVAIGAAAWIFILKGKSESSPTGQTTTSAADQTVTKDFLTYENANYGIKIKYPPTWLKQDGLINTVAMFLSPKEKETDPFIENLNIVFEDLSSRPMSLEQYTALNLTQLQAYIFDFKLIDSEAAVLAGNPAQKVVYTGRQGQNRLKWLQVWTVKNNKAYVITYTAEKNKHSNI